MSDIPESARALALNIATFVGGDWHDDDIAGIAGDIARAMHAYAEAQRLEAFEKTREAAAKECDEMSEAARDVSTRDRECERMHLHAATACHALALRIRALKPEDVLG